MVDVLKSLRSTGVRTPVRVPYARLQNVRARTFFKVCPQVAERKTPTTTVLRPEHLPIATGVNRTNAQTLIMFPRRSSYPLELDLPCEHQEALRCWRLVQRSRTPPRASARARNRLRGSQGAAYTHSSAKTNTLADTISQISLA